MTYKCNDTCSFCLAYDQIRNKVADISLDSFIRNLEYFYKRSKIIKVILTGGEPTLHPEFFNALECLNKKKIPINVITNAIKFTDKNFLAKTKQHFFNASTYNKIIFSLNDISVQADNNKIHKNLSKREKGIINLAESQLPSLCIITITKNNASYLDKIVNFLIELKKEYNLNLKSVEIRMLYISMMPNYLLKKSLPDKFDEISLPLKKAIRRLKSNNIIYNLWNLPLCYLENSKEHKNIGLNKRLKTDIIKVDANHQYTKADFLNWQKYFRDHPECINCSLQKYCSGVDPGYLYLDNYPKLKTIK